MGSPRTTEDTVFAEETPSLEWDGVSRTRVARLQSAEPWATAARSVVIRPISSARRNIAVVISPARGGTPYPDGGFRRWLQRALRTSPMVS
jgi:hypothetical protein